MRFSLHGLQEITFIFDDSEPRDLHPVEKFSANAGKTSPQCRKAESKCEGVEVVDEKKGGMIHY